MNKITLSLLTMLVLAVHLNWRISKLSRGFHEAEQAAVGITLKKLRIRDIFVDLDYTPFDISRQADLQDCLTAKDRSDRAIQKCVESSNISIFSEPFIEHAWDGGVAKESDYIPFHARSADLGRFKGRYVGGLLQATSLAGGSPAQTQYLTVEVTVEEPTPQSFRIVFASQYPFPKGLVENDHVKDDVAAYLPQSNRSQPLALNLDDDLRDIILKAAAKQGFTATQWEDAFRQLRTKSESELYTLPLLNIEVPATIVGTFLVLVSVANLYQYKQGILRTMAKASNDPKSDEQYWLTTIQQSRLLNVIQRLMLLMPLATLAFSVPVWLQESSPIPRTAATALAALLACLLIASALTCWKALTTVMVQGRAK